MPITNAGQLLTELKRIEGSPEAADLELLTIMLSETASSLVGLRPNQLGLMRAEPEFEEIRSAWGRMYARLEDETFSDSPVLSKKDLPPIEVYGPAYDKIYGT